MFIILSVEIVECNSAHNCSSQGICGPDGACDCDPSFYGDNCSSKLRKICDEYLVDFKTNMFSLQTFFVAVCHYLLTCSDNGVCSDVGTCQCDEGFFGDSCSSKHDNSLLVFCKVLYICVVFWLLAHLTLDLFQVEKKKMLLLAEQMPQMTTISLKIVEVVILSENQVLNGPIAKNQCIYTI